MDKSVLNAGGRRFEFLDGLRGIAALLVTCLHFHTLIVERTEAYFPVIFENLFKNGNFGVQIFFVLSGFVIAYSIRNETITSSFIMRFFIRRSIRLDPPYWITLILLTALIFLGSTISNHPSDYAPSLNNFALNAFYLPGFFGVDYILPVAWTLCMEFQFYIFFVLMIKTIQHLNRWKGMDVFDYSSLFGVLTLSPMLLLSLLEAVKLSPLKSLPGLFIPYWYSFLCGSLVCWIVMERIKGIYFWLAIMAVGIFSVFTMNSDMAVTLLTALTILLVAKREKLHEILSGSIFQYLGKVSYSLYLIHWPVGIKFMTILLFVFGPQANALPSLVLLLIALAVTLLATHFFYKYVEYPSIQLCKRFGKAPVILQEAKL